MFQATRTRIAAALVVAAGAIAGYLAATGPSPLAAAGRPAQGRPQRPTHHDR